MKGRQIGRGLTKPRWGCDENGPFGKFLAKLVALAMTFSVGATTCLRASEAEAE